MSQLYIGTVLSAGIDNRTLEKKTSLWDVFFVILSLFFILSYFVILSEAKDLPHDTSPTYIRTRFCMMLATSLAVFCPLKNAAVSSSMISITFLSVYCI